MSTHSPLSVYHLLYSNLIPQHPVPLASMSPNRSHQHPQHPRASPVAPFSPHLKDCPLYSRKPFCISIFSYRSVTHRSPDTMCGGAAHFFHACPQTQPYQSDFTAAARAGRQAPDEHMRSREQRHFYSAQHRMSAPHKDGGGLGTWADAVTETFCSSNGA
jgi:hypothetical protein